MGFGAIIQSRISQVFPILKRHLSKKESLFLSASEKTSFNGSFYGLGRVEGHLLRHSVLSTRQARVRVDKQNGVLFGALMAGLFVGGSTSLASQDNMDVFRSVFHRQYQRVRDLAGQRPADLNERHPFGWLPIHIAVANHDMQMVKLLLELGCDPNTQDMFTLNPETPGQPQDPWQQMASGTFSIHGPENLLDLFFVGSGGFKDMEQIMWRRNVRYTEFSGRISAESDTEGFSSLHYAVVLGSADLTELLLKHGADSSIRAKNGKLPIDYLPYSPEKDREKIRKLLISHQIKLQAAKEESAREERRKFPLEAKIKERIVGQTSAINLVSGAIRRKENRWHDEDRPLVFLFLGSSGIGKTEMAKTIAEYLHGNDEGAFIRFDMSEFQQKHEVSKFIGSPPGYVGHDEGGALTERLRKNPSAVVLLDEVEKAHADVLTIMLQLFDEGRLTDGKGETIECKGAIFIMTSNLGQTQIAEHGSHLRRLADEKIKAKESAYKDAERNAQSTGSPTEPNDSSFTCESNDKLLLRKSNASYLSKTKNEDEIQVERSFNDNVIRPILKRHFKRDEFLGRINEIVYFLPFSESELHELVNRELRKWETRANSRHGITLSWDESVIQEISKAYNIYYGARSLKYEVDRRVINMLADAWEQNRLKKNNHVHITTQNSNIDFTILNK